MRLRSAPGRLSDGERPCRPSFAMGAVCRETGFARQQIQAEQDPPQPELAAVGMEPFGGSMRPSALPASSDGDSRKSQGERDVGVRGGTVQARSDAEQAV